MQNPFNADDRTNIRTATFVIGFDAASMAEFVSRVDNLHRDGTMPHVVGIQTAWSEDRWDLISGEAAAKVRGTEADLHFLAMLYPILVGGVR